MRRYWITKIVNHEACHKQLTICTTGMLKLWMGFPAHDCIIKIIVVIMLVNFADLKQELFPYICTRVTVIEDLMIIKSSITVTRVQI